MDRVLAETGALPGTAGREEYEDHGGLPKDALVAALAAICAALDLPAGTAAATGSREYPGRMPVWKRAGLAELMRRDTGIRDFV